MRIYKFRAWDKTNKVMIKNYDDWFGRNMVIAYDGSVRMITTTGDIWMRTDMELMQFTGLLDKAGVEIYEGDLVKNDHNVISKIIWFNELGCWGYTCDDKVIAAFSSVIMEGGQYENEKMEVIGNVFEDKELL